MVYERSERAASAAKYERIHLYRAVNDFNAVELHTLLASHFNKNAAKAETYLPSNASTPRDTTPANSVSPPPPHHSNSSGSDDNDEWNSVSSGPSNRNHHHHHHRHSSGTNSSSSSAANGRRRGRDLLAEMYRSRTRV